MNGSLIGRPYLASAILLGIILVSGPFAIRLIPDNTIEAYTPEDHPSLLLYDEVRAKFPHDSTLIALFEGEELYERSFLQPLAALVEEMEGHPLVERVLSVLEFEHIQATADGFAVEVLVDLDKLDERTPEEWRQRVLESRFVPGLIASSDGTAMAIVIRPIYPADYRLRSLEHLRLERTLEQAVQDHGLGEQLIAIAGDVALESAQIKSVGQIMLVIIPIIQLMALLVIWWLFRNIRLVLLTQFVTLGVVTPVLGAFGLFGFPFLNSSTCLMGLLTALSTAMTMHLLNAVVQAKQNGYSGAERVRVALDRVQRPSFYMALTTAACMLTLTLSEVPPIRHFGYLGAFGLTCMFIVVVVLLPPMIAQWVQEDFGAERLGLNALDPFLKLVRTIVFRRAGWVVLVSTLLTVVLAAQIWKVHSEADFYAFFRDEHRLNVATRKVEERLSGVGLLEIVLQGPGRDSLHSPERLEVVRNLQDWLNNQPEVGYTLSMVDLIEEMHWAFNDEDPAYRSIPDNQALIAQYLFIYDGGDLYELVDRELAETRIFMLLNVTRSSHIWDVIERIERQLDEVDTLDLEWATIGRSRLIAEHIDMLVEGQVRSIYAVIVLVTLLMLLMWRFVSGMAITLPPNLGPAIMMFGVMGLFGIWLDAGSAVVSSVLIGIGLDDTIHFFHAYKKRRDRGVSVVFAMARAIKNTGRAITATTIVLCAQFLIIANSTYVPAVNYARLGAIGLLFALYLDLFFLPALLVTVERLRRRYRGRERKPEESTEAARRIAG